MTASWEDRAACVGLNPRLFFPATGANADVAAAKAVCAGCPVRRQCLDAHLGEREGIWAGTTEPERRKIRMQRQRAAA